MHALDISKNFDAIPHTDEGLRFIIKMIEAVTGEEELRKDPILTVSISPTSPLQFSGDVVKRARYPFS